VVDLTGTVAQGALIGKQDRRGRLLWSLPKGHLETGETAEQAAVREVAEETGIVGEIVASLGTIDFWFVADGRRIHKTVHHFLLRATGGALSDADIEVTEVAWVPLPDIASRWPTRRAQPRRNRRTAVGGDGLTVRLKRVSALGALLLVTFGAPLVDPTSALAAPSSTPLSVTILNVTPRLPDATKLDQKITCRSG
jgi:ADP-ribose pyrophosphatase